VRVVVERGLLSDQSSVCAVFDLNTADELVTSLKDAYAGLDVLHTIAAKAVPLQALLRHLAQEHDLGCEVASPGELALALAAGFEPARIIYDSPAKTASDIAMALQLGVPFNIDNAEELARVDAMVAAWTGPLPRIGMRINPQSGAGLIHAMSTATQTSKFGIGLVDSRDAVIEMYLSRPWLRQIHVHSGSQGLALEHTANDVRAVVELAEDIERAAGEQRIELIDVGGGLSVTFESDLTAPTFHDHASALREAAPALFTGKYQIATEFGRSLTAKAGTLLGNVEYVKQAGPRSIAVTHVGVQVAARTVFMPQAWPLRIEVYAPDGTRRTAETAETGIYDVAGPACFAGDLIAVERALPKIESGDIIAVPDTGGYYATNHFAYNSLARPAIYATRAGGLGEPRTLLLARRAQTIAEVVAESGEAVLSELR
jgi:diaminopimelate decarboxylase